MEYPKINSLWKRQGVYYHEESQKLKKFVTGADRMALIPGDYACLEFGAIKNWRVCEKIDGMNIRIMWEDVPKLNMPGITFAGKTSNAQIPATLFKCLQETFTIDKMKQVFPPKEIESKGVYYPKVILFGEGYGPKIQACGSCYRKDPGFILFDVWCDGWWLKHEDVKMIADKLAIPMVPDLGIMCEEKIMEYVKSKPPSYAVLVPQILERCLDMEGIVARSEPLMLFRNGNPIMWKLKTRDFI